MCEKRFVPITEHTEVGEIQAIYDNEEEKTYRNVHSICELLNEKVSENVNRFTLKDYGYGGFDIFDSTGEYKESDLYKNMTPQQITDCLNKLNDENEKLRFLININSVSERTKLERQVDEQQATITELKEEMVRLHKMSIELMDRVIPNLRRENEQLKRENSAMKEEQNEMIAHLKKQNEQLRTELSDCEKFRYQVFKRIGELNDE